MSNTIKFINLESLGYNLENHEDVILDSIEKDKNIKGKYFFFVDETEHDLFFTENKELLVIEYLTLQLNIESSVIINYIHDFGEWLCEMSSEDDKEIYNLLYDKLQKTEIIINLIEAGSNFKQEFQNMKNEVLKNMTNEIIGR